MEAVLRMDPIRSELELEVDGECFDVTEIDNVFEPYEDGGKLLIAILGQAPEGFPPDTVVELFPSSLDSETQWEGALPEEGVTFGIGPAGESMVKTTSDPPEGFPASSVFVASPISTTVEEVDGFDDEDEDGDIAIVDDDGEDDGAEDDDEDDDEGDDE